jgi:hypothetical protein
MIVGWCPPGPIATSARLWSAITGQPLLARTGPTSFETICQL